MKVLVVFAFLIAIPLAAATGTTTGDSLGSTLKAIARGDDPGFGRDIAPALSVDTARPAPERADAVIDRMSTEFDTVLHAFLTASATERISKTRAAVARVDPETAEKGASRHFQGKGPYLSLMRQLLFVPSAAAGAEPAARILRIVSGFEHAPRAEDTYYEYADPENLKRSAIATLAAAKASAGGEEALAMRPGGSYVLKKCRHVPVLGWYCNTSRYAVRILRAGDVTAELLLTFLVPLPPGADNAMFHGGRAENVVDGYTAAYLVLATADTSLVYNLGIQSRAGALSMQSRLNREQQKESRELAQALKTALGISHLAWEPVEARAAPHAPGGYSATRTR